MMALHFRHLAFAIAILMLGAPAAAGTYTLDSNHTEVRVSWDHLGLTRQSARFMDVKGTIEFDPLTPANNRAAIIIKVASIATGSKKLDKHLIETKDFFDVAAYPEITFNSTAVRVTGEKTFELDGDLKINGQVRTVVLSVVWNFSGEHPLASLNPAYTGKFSSGFSATTEFRRSDWGITRSAPLVSDELQVAIEVEMLRKGDIRAPETAPMNQVNMPTPEPQPGISPSPAGPPAPDEVLSGGLKAPLPPADGPAPSNPPANSQPSPPFEDSPPPIPSEPMLPPEPQVPRE